MEFHKHLPQMWDKENKLAVLLRKTAPHRELRIWNNNTHAPSVFRLQNVSFHNHEIRRTCIRTINFQRQNTHMNPHTVCKSFLHSVMTALKKSDVTSND